MRATVWTFPLAAVVELDVAPGLDLELSITWFDGRFDAAWIWSATEEVVGWARVGVA